MLKSFLKILNNLDSSTERRRITLHFANSLVLFSAIVFYSLDILFGKHMERWVYFVSAGVSLLSFVLVTYSVELAIGLFFLYFNFIFFLVMSSEPFKAGFNFHMFTLGFLAMNIYGFKRRVVGIAFAVLSASLAMLSHIGLPPLLQYRDYGVDEIPVYFIVNGVFYVMSTPVLLFFTLDWNFRAEKKLTEQKVLADRQNREMSKINEELDQFVYKTSHDLRAPLNEIMNLAQLSEREPENQSTYFEKMKNQVALMDENIREIIDYSRNTRLEVRSATVQLESLIGEVISSLRSVPGFSSIEFKQNLSAQQIHCDVDRLKILLRNLMFNGIKYKDPSKPEAVILIEAGASENDYWLKVTDNGIGIEKKHQEKIFDMFYKGNDISKGSGLGLYMVKETVSKMRGDVKLSSSPGQGSEFTVLLPRN